MKYAKSTAYSTRRCPELLHRKMNYIKCYTFTSRYMSANVFKAFINRAIGNTILHERLNCMEPNAAPTCSSLNIHGIFSKRRGIGRRMLTICRRLSANVVSFTCSASDGSSHSFLRASRPEKNNTSVQR